MGDVLRAFAKGTGSSRVVGPAHRRADGPAPRGGPGPVLGFRRGRWGSGRRPGAASSARRTERTNAVTTPRRSNRRHVIRLRQGARGRLPAADRVRVSHPSLAGLAIGNAVSTLGGDPTPFFIDRGAAARIPASPCPLRTTTALPAREPSVRVVQCQAARAAGAGAGSRPGCLASESADEPSVRVCRRRGACSGCGRWSRRRGSCSLQRRPAGGGRNSTRAGPTRRSRSATVTGYCSGPESGSMPPTSGGCPRGPMGRPLCCYRAAGASPNAYTPARAAAAAGWHGHGPALGADARPPAACPRPVGPQGLAAWH